MKPKPEIFTAAINAAKCNPEEMIHIGDSYDKDIIGAKSVNMNYIWINHNDTIEKKVNEKYAVRNFFEIRKLLDKIG
jgi:FMN phosphatase YigB (HAD superfamily)